MAKAALERGNIMRIHWSTLVLGLVALAAAHTSPVLAQCNDNNSCTNDALVGGVCVHTPVPDGSFCIERFFPCFPNPFCSAGVCQMGPIADCSDGNPCTSDFCSIAGGGRCVHSPITGPCDDGNVCTGNGQCVNSSCVGANPIPGPCDDGNLCTTSDHCANGSCTGNLTQCPAESQCTTGVCDPADGSCQVVNLPAGFGCDDGDLCTVADLCDGDGACLAGVPAPPCDDGNTCTDDACVAPTGCVFASNDTCGDNPEDLNYWKRLCQGPHPSGEFISQQDVSCVTVSCAFAGQVSDPLSLCDHLDANPSNDKCEQADAEFMALLLNVCRGRTPVELPIRSHCSDNTTVGQSRAEADGILCSPLREHKTCTRAQCLSEEINSGWAP